MKYLKTIGAGAAVLLSLLPAAALASVVVNEIMYDLPGTDDPHEWVEIANTGPDAVTVATGTAGWRFYDGANHIINSPAQGNTVIAPGDFAVLADDAQTFLADHPGFPGTLFDTVVSLGNTGDTVRLIDGNGITLDEISYVSAWGATGNGKTLERRADGAWGESAGEGGTPGATNSLPSPTPLPTPTPTPELTPSPTPTPSPPTGGSGPSASPTLSPSPSSSPVPTASTSPPTPSPTAQPPATPTVLPKMHISEFYPNTTGVDADEEFVELWNEESAPADISGWELDDAEGGSSVFSVLPGTTIAARGYLAFFRKETGITLNNDIDAVRLITPGGQIVEHVTYKDAPKGQSLNRTASGAYAWSSRPTPGSANVIAESISVAPPTLLARPAVSPQTSGPSVSPAIYEAAEAPIQTQYAKAESVIGKEPIAPSTKTFAEPIVPATGQGALIVEALPKKPSKSLLIPFLIASAAAGLAFLIRLRRRKTVIDR